MTHLESGAPPCTCASGDWVLAIDTSTERAGLALGNTSRLFERSWEAGRTQTTSVLPTIDALLKEAHIGLNDLAAVAIATGPGTFTGLRVGMSIAKGFVLAREIPLIGIPTLDIAAGAAVGGTDLIAVLPAGRGRVVWQRYGPVGDQEPRNTTVLQLVEHLTGIPEVLVIGEVAPEHQQTIERSHNRTQWENRQPKILLERARERWLRGEEDDPVTLAPTYLHGVIVTAGPVRDQLHKK